MNWGRNRDYVGNVGNVGNHGNVGNLPKVSNIPQDYVPEPLGNVHPLPCRTSSRARN